MIKLTDQSVTKVIVHTNLRNLIRWSRSKSDSSASIDGELFWSTRVYEIPNSNIKWPKQVLNFGHCYLFDIWYLWFGISSHSSRLPQDRNIFGQLNRPGLCEVLRDIIKSYVFWSSWWVGWFRTTGPADAFLIVRMKKIDWRPRESNRLHT